MIIPLEDGCIYHIYNRGNIRENLFREDCNNDYFLELSLEYTDPIASTFAHCLMPNHFHSLVRIEESIPNGLDPSTSTPISSTAMRNRSTRPMAEPARYSKDHFRGFWFIAIHTILSSFSTFTRIQ